MHLYEHAFAFVDEYEHAWLNDVFLMFRCL